MSDRTTVDPVQFASLHAGLERGGQTLASPVAPALDHVIDLLASTLERLCSQAVEVDQRVTTLQNDVLETEEKLKRFYRMDEDGVAAVDDLRKERIADPKHARNEAMDVLERIPRSRIGSRSLDPALIEVFSRVMRDNITAGEIPFRKTYISSLADRIEMDDRGFRIVADNGQAKIDNVIEPRAKRKAENHA